jgi:hypothetical protein
VFSNNSWKYSNTCRGPEQFDRIYNCVSLEGVSKILPKEGLSFPHFGGQAERGFHQLWATFMLASGSTWC